MVIPICLILLMWSRILGIQYIETRNPVTKLSSSLRTQMWVNALGNDFSAVACSNAYSVFSYHQDNYHMAICPKRSCAVRSASWFVETRITLWAHLTSTLVIYYSTVLYTYNYCIHSIIRFHWIIQSACYSLMASVTVKQVAASVERYHNLLP